MKLYLVNETPDGSGRWRNIFSKSWGAADHATNFTDREEVDMVARTASECGGHVVEFTMGGAKPEPREPDGSLDIWNGRCVPRIKGKALQRARATGADSLPLYVGEPPPAPAEREPATDDDWEARYVDIADELGWVNRGEGTGGYEVAPHERIMEAVRDGKHAWTQMTEPREPDYWLARTEGGDFRRNGGIRSEFTASEWASDYGTPVPVYVGEPPPAPPADPVMADLLETNGRLLAEKDDALEEVSRLSKALDETRLLRETNERLTKQHSAVEEQMNLLRDALGWNGGTLRDAALAVKWLKEALDSREPAPADTPIRCPYCGAAHYPQTVDFCPCPADTPAMVEARRRVGEGWRAHPSIPDWAHHDESERSAPVGKAVVDAMRALRGGK